MHQPWMRDLECIEYLQEGINSMQSADRSQWYEECVLCPRRCRVNRAQGEIGFCGQSSESRIARAALHFWEEPELSGGYDCADGDAEDDTGRGSGTVFFTGCNLCCIYCQNYAISRDRRPGSENGGARPGGDIDADCAGDIGRVGRVGRNVDEEELADIFLDLQRQGARNINLVTAFMHMPHVLDALDIAKANGLSIPIVYNSSGYESLELLKAMEGYIDIYLPDLKYVSEDLAAELSHAPDYPQVAKAAIAEMVRQTKTIVRHLVLPGHVQESKRVLDYLYETYAELLGSGSCDAESLQEKNPHENSDPHRLQISIMSQYTPVAAALHALSGRKDFRPPEKGDGAPRNAHPELDRRITKREYDRVVDHAIALGITNAYIQDRSVAKESFIPPF